jgi:hypothetical protein
VKKMSKLNLVTGYAGKPHVSSVDHGALNTMIFGNDSFVLPFGAMFEASIVRQDDVQAEIVIADGDMMMQGRHVRLAKGETEQVNIPMPPQHYYRKDLIVLRYEKDITSGVESCSIARLEGEEDEALLGTPSHTTGDLTDAGCILHEVPLYRIVMYDAKITDIEQLFTVKNPLYNINTPAVQFGHAVIEHSVGRSTSVYVEFPIRFERTPHVFVSQVFNNANIVVKTTEVTSAGFTARLDPVSYNEWRPFSWFAIA